MAKFSYYLLKALKEQPLVRENWGYDLYNVIVRLGQFETYAGQPTSWWYGIDNNTGVEYGNPKISNYPHMRISYSGSPERVYIRDRIDQIRDIVGIPPFVWKFTPSKNDFDNATNKCGIDSRQLLEMLEAIGRPYGVSVDRYSRLKFYSEYRGSDGNKIYKGGTRIDSNFTIRTTTIAYNRWLINGDELYSKNMHYGTWGQLYHIKNELNEESGDGTLDYYTIFQRRDIVGVKIESSGGVISGEMDWHEMDNIDAISIISDNQSSLRLKRNVTVENRIGEVKFMNSFSANNRYWYFAYALGGNKNYGSEDIIALNESELVGNFTHFSDIQGNSNLTISSSLPDGTYDEGYTYYFLSWPCEISDITFHLNNVKQAKCKVGEVRTLWNSIDVGQQFNSMLSNAQAGVRNMIRDDIPSNWMMAGACSSKGVHAGAWARINGPESSYYWSLDEEDSETGWLWWKEFRIARGWPESLINTTNDSDPDD